MEKPGGISTAAVRAATGKGWEEWLSILDAAGATEMTHPEIARLLAEQHGVADWWCQMVTVGYEQARGMRAVHQKTDGFVANGSKTIAVSVTRLYEAWADETQRDQWLGDARLTVHRATPGKSVRARWAADDSPVDVYLVAKGENKSQVSIQHARLTDAESRAALKAFWGEALARLKNYLEEQEGHPSR